MAYPCTVPFGVPWQGTGTGYGVGVTGFSTGTSIGQGTALATGRPLCLDLDWNSFSDSMRSPRISTLHTKRRLICWAKAVSGDVTLGRESAKNAHNSASSSWRR